MPPVCYSVLATFPGETAAADYLQWLAEGHVRGVLQGGAESAQVVRLHPSQGSPGSVQIEARYVFPDVSTFETYLKDHAPRLRAQSAARFGSMQGVSWERREGTVILTEVAGVRPT